MNALSLGNPPNRCQGTESANPGTAKGDGSRTRGNSTFKPNPVKKFLGSSLRGIRSKPLAEVDLETLDLLVERGGLQAEERRRPPLDAVGALQALRDDLPLEFLHGLVEGELPFVHQPLHGRSPDRLTVDRLGQEISPDQGL